MTDFLLRDLEPELMQTLKHRARLNKRSLQNEMQAILQLSVERERRLAFLKKVEGFLEETKGRPAFDSTEAIRHDRDAGHKPWLGY
jgi:plasmid stability protein